MPELWQLSAARLVQGYRAGEFTPVDVLDACLARAAACQPHLNAFVMLDRSGARMAASASRVRWARRQPLGPLDGVPVSVKDNLHAAGLPTTWGSQLLKGFVARRDELPVARLRAAGAIIIGKTNLPEFAMQGYTHNLVAGTTRNPWNPALTPGGSSGGGAAAVAAGCGPLALATDGGGSIRRPAAHTGLVGFKPSAGAVPREGGLPDLFLGHEVAGALGRSVDDVARVFRVLAARPAAAAEATAPAPAQAPPTEALRVRVLYVPRFAAHPLDPDIAARTQQAAARLATLDGVVVEEWAATAGGFDLAEDVNARWPLLSQCGLAWMLGDAAGLPEFQLAAGTLPDITLCTEAMQTQLSEGLAAEGAALFELCTATTTLSQRMAALFERCDLLLTPTTAALPWPAALPFPQRIDGTPVGPRGHAVYTALANAAGLPAISLPAGFVNGMPTGVQLIGRPGADEALLALAERYEAACPWADAWPALPV